MNLYSGKTALITGASSGIGEVFAHALAKRGLSLVLVARSEDKLQALATTLRQHHASTFEVIPADLTQTHAAHDIYNTVQERGLTVDMLVNNAGFSTNGSFATVPAEQDHQQVMLNVVSVVDLTHAFIPAMLARGSGSIINVASTAAFYPLAFQSVYGASKAFVLSFSEALWAEYHERGLRVVALCPGATDTNFFSAMGKNTQAFKHAPDIVVASGLQALEEGKSYIIPGRRNAFEAGVLPRFLPRSLMARIVAQQSQKFWGNR